MIARVEISADHLSDKMLPRVIAPAIHELFKQYEDLTGQKLPMVRSYRCELGNVHIELKDRDDG